jgi:hypothetical protein
VGRSTRRLGRRASVLAVALLPLLPIFYAAGCVDGVTPNCADPAIQCGVDATADSTEAALLPEASRLDSSGAEAAMTVDAPADGDLDAGDEG